jgi:hypothetical protein
MSIVQLKTTRVSKLVAFGLIALPLFLGNIDPASAKKVKIKPDGTVIVRGGGDTTVQTGGGTTTVETSGRKTSQPSR